MRWQKSRYLFTMIFVVSVGLLLSTLPVFGLTHRERLLLSRQAFEALQEFDKLFENFFVWVANQYDPATGGFYYAQSSKEHPRFQPDIESTAQALNIIRAAGLLEDIPEVVRQKMIAFFQTRQDPVTGHFLDPHNEMATIERLRVRATNYSVGALNALGAKPLYPLPGQPRNLASYQASSIVLAAAGPVLTPGVTLVAWDLPPGVPWFMRSPQDYRQWMENLDWSHPWGAGDEIAETTLYLQAMPDALRKAFLEEAFEFIESTQDPVTGMWGSNVLYNQVSGAFKIGTFYKRVGRPLPRVEAIYETVLHCMRTEVANHFCFVRNPVDLLSQIKSELPGRVEYDLLEIIEISKKNMASFLQPDGAFSVYPDRSNPAPNRVMLGLGRKEADMNASTQAVTTRNALYDLAGLLPPEFPKEYTEGFWDIILTKEMEYQASGNMI